jgi:predicted RNA-binding Zn-ribbon protein involved in translation (DUF1610 family)
MDTMKEIDQDACVACGGDIIDDNDPELYTCKDCGSTANYTDTK